MGLFDCTSRRESAFTSRQMERTYVRCYEAMAIGAPTPMLPFYSSAEDGLDSLKEDFASILPSKVWNIQVSQFL